VPPSGFATETLRVPSGVFASTAMVACSPADGPSGAGGASGRLVIVDGGSGSGGRSRAIDAVVTFVELVNRGDADGLGTLMTDDHALVVFDEPPLIGRDANVAAWQGYATAHPAYVIHPHEMIERGGSVAVLGHTTGSHLGLPDDEERALTLVWIADVVDARLASWRLVEDTPELRREWGFTPDPSI
jgi:ketosteroid isomerase-like protein